MQNSFFNLANRYASLSEAGDPLERLNAAIDWGKAPAKLAHKDTDARWTKKGGQNHYGYKNHINIDRDTKLITAHACTNASVHDSQVLVPYCERPIKVAKPYGRTVRTTRLSRNKASRAANTTAGFTNALTAASR